MQIISLLPASIALWACGLGKAKPRSAVASFLCDIPLTLGESRNGETPYGSWSLTDRRLWPPLRLNQRGKKVMLQVGGGPFQTSPTQKVSEKCEAWTTLKIQHVHACVAFLCMTGWRGPSDWSSMTIHYGDSWPFFQDQFCQTGGCAEAKDARQSKAWQNAPHKVSDPARRMVLGSLKTLLVWKYGMSRTLGYQMIAI